MAVPYEGVLRQRVCRGNGCHAVFWICRTVIGASAIAAWLAAPKRASGSTAAPTAGISEVWKAGWTIAIANGTIAAAGRECA